LIVSTGKRRIKYRCAITIEIKSIAVCFLQKSHVAKRERGEREKKERDRQRETIEKPYPVHAQVPHEAG